jgi:hypothetical protein
MRNHCPESSQCVRRQMEPELLDIYFNVCLDEGISPIDAVGIIHA